MMVEWLRTVDGNLQLHLGPQLCKKQAAVNAGHLIRVRSLLTAFLNSGLKNGVLNASRLEAGIRGSLSQALVKVDAGVNVDLLSHQLAEHLRFCLNTLRFYKMEQVNPPACGVSKVASLLRHATTAELVIINGMTEKIELQEVRAESVTRQPSLSPACSPRSSQGDSSEKVPDCFAKYLASHRMADPDDEVFADSYVARSPMETTPKRLNLEATVKESQPLLNVLQCSLLDTPPVNPNVRARKAAALAVRADKSKKEITDAAKDKRTSKENAKLKTQKAERVPKDAKLKTQKAERVPKDAEKVVSNPALSVGSGLDYRLELCAFDADSKRVYIFGGASAKYGPELKSHGETLKHYIKTTPNVTKAMALRRLRGLQTGEDVD